MHKDEVKHLNPIGKGVSDNSLKKYFDESARIVQICKQTWFLPISHSSED